jgi:hypothetical protein
MSCATDICVLCLLRASCIYFHQQATTKQHEPNAIGTDVNTNSNIKDDPITTINDDLNKDGLKNINDESNKV